MSFSSTLRASLLASEPESEIGEALPSKLVGPVIVDIVDRALKRLWGFLVLRKCVD